MTQQSARLFFLDWARSALMLLGVVLHTANVYTTGSKWFVVDPDGSSVYGAISGIIHVFRMPAFFLISGYFLAMNLERRTRGLVMRQRLPRIVLPLLVVMFTLNILQPAVLESLRGKGFFHGLRFSVQPYHLWFLIDLLIFNAIAILIWSIPRSVKHLPSIKSFWLLVVVLGLGTFLCELTVRLTGHAYHNFFLTVSLFELAYYGTFFGFGMIARTQSHYFELLKSSPWWAILPAAALAYALRVLQIDQGRWLSELMTLLSYWATWYAVAATIATFHRFFSDESKVAVTLSDASYSIYLFHHIMVVIGGALLIGINLPSVVKFILLILVAFAISMLLHRIVVRPYRVVSLILNGKWSGDSMWPRVTRWSLASRPQATETAEPL